MKTADQINNKQDVYDFFKELSETYNVYYHPEDDIDEYDAFSRENNSVLTAIEDAVKRCRNVAEQEGFDICEVAMKAYDLD